MKQQIVLAAGLALSSLMAPLAQAATTLTVYTALEADQVKEYKEAFEKANPDIEIRFVRESTGIITAKLLSEKQSAGRRGVGLAATSLMILDQQGMLQPYAPKGVEKLSPAFVDKAKPPKWTGMDVWAATICSTPWKRPEEPAQARELGGSDKPAYKGQIVMPPGVLRHRLSGRVRLAADDGREKGWDYMDKLHANMAQYVHSGSKPCKMAAAGEYPIGISFEYRGAQLKERARR